GRYVFRPPSATYFDRRSQQRLGLVANDFDFVYSRKQRQFLPRFREVDKLIVHFLQGRPSLPVLAEELVSQFEWLHDFSSPWAC
ncbi:MAG: hypothetical protein AABZ47_09885, partial [Planctomycetota bacterium]